MDVAEEMAAIGALRCAVEAASDAATAYLAAGRQDSARRAAARARELHVPDQGSELPRIDGLDAAAIELTAPRSTADRARPSGPHQWRDRRPSRDLRTNRGDPPVPGDAEARNQRPPRPLSQRAPGHRESMPRSLREIRILATGALGTIGRHAESGSASGTRRRGGPTACVRGRGGRPRAVVFRRCAPSPRSRGADCAIAAGAHAHAPAAPAASPEAAGLSA